MINWFWAHRRNSSLHHMSLLVKGLKSKGFLPVVDFHFDNQIVIGKPNKGCYLFYDKDQINRKFKDIQKSIDSNSNFPDDFKKTNDKIFLNLFKVCKKLEQEDLTRLSNQEILDILIDFKTKITVGPLITVQLWGIEACWDEDYILAKELNEEKEFQKIKGILSQSTGKSVAFSERESFLKVLIEIQKNPKSEKELIKEHIKNFEWVNSEYVSEKLTLDQWTEIFKKELKINAKSELDKLYSKYNAAIDKKNKLISRLSLSKQATHAVNALNEFVSQRDWAKGKFCYALSCYNILLNEISKRLDTPQQDLLYYEIDELIKALESGSSKSIDKRKQGFSLVSKNGKLQIFEEIDKIIADENLTGVFSDVKDTVSFKGVVASTGKTTGKVRVIEDPKEISDFKPGEIIVTYMTTMEFTPIFKKAKGVITDEGGLSSHAAIISREFGLPCVVGTKIATRTLKTGDIVELNAEKGIIKKLR